ncbi:MAG: alpha-amylase [Planctomycetaceae bacterium]|nr:alpha-amylase [Planctomycetaceae bacterium]
MPPFPALYQINTRVVLNELAQTLGRPATLDDLTDAMLDGLASLGFDWIWFLGVWQTGPAGRAVARALTDWQREYLRVLPDLTDDDICGSPFAVEAYATSSDFGGDAALARLRQRLRKRGLALMLDFVPNHTAIDHPWVALHPEYYIAATDDDIAREPYNYIRLRSRSGPRVFAYGRDPYFAGWPDTLQLNYRSHALRQAMIDELQSIAARCDGVRCDMAMLLLPEVIERTWGDKSLPSDGTLAIDAPFWPEAIAKVRSVAPDFTCMAEVYWDLEWTLQQQGFDFTYDKRLYDRLQAQDASGVRGHFHADPEFQRRLARFLENHDEPRGALAFSPEVYKAAAVVTYFVPGLRFFHEGQFDGRRTRVPMQVCRRPVEAVDGELQQFYDRLLRAVRQPAFREGAWGLVGCRAAWDGNPTWERFIAGLWTGADNELELVAINYGPTRGQCYVGGLPRELWGRRCLLRDRLSPAQYEREGTDLCHRGLYLDLPPWGFHVFEIEVR